jgi:diguanylate cyclase (GGDEF)-like protein
MRLATITNWAYGATVALTLASGVTMLLASAAQNRERSAVAQRYDLDRATSTIDEDVAILSNLARQFAISGRASDLGAYRHEAGLLQPLKQRTGHFRDAGAGVDELRDLQDALHWADSLRDEQQLAIAARQRGHRSVALEILFSPEYERELDRIQNSVERFQNRIDQRTGGVLQVAIGTSRIWRSASDMLLAMTALLFLGVLFFIFRQRVLRPVVRLSDVVTRLAAQDYNAEPPPYDRIDEIGDMAQAIRVFRENGIERQRLETERDGDRSMRDLLSRMTQRMQSCDTVRDLEAVIERFVPEVAPQLGGRLYLLDGPRNAMVEACSWLAPVHSLAEFAPVSCWALRRGGVHRAMGDYVDVPCDHIQVEGAALPDSICFPLGAQHGVLGLLYFERPASVAVSEIPDVYLKMLAENIGLALDNLRLRDALRELALADPLTTLANRRQLDIVLDIQLVESKRTGKPISCAMIDVDHFKRFNDDHGHDAGDAVLRAVGTTLKQLVREEDFVCRYGGEEFLLLMPGVDAELAERRGEDVRARIASLHLRHEGQNLGSITISLGIATAPSSCRHDRLVQAADTALLRAKRAGRNRLATARPRHARESSAA